MLALTREEICTFVEKSILDKQYNDELSFPISDITIERVKKKLYLNLEGYMGIISSHSVRHVHKGHATDIEYICEILDIVKTFFKVEKSVTRDHKTGASLVSLAFYKKYNSDMVKLVKLKIHREKRLELKTLFIKD